MPEHDSSTQHVRVELRPIGVIRSTLTSRHDAPKQGSEGAPDAWLDVHSWAADGLLGIVQARAPGAT
jgi:hypothetical protein